MACRAGRDMPGEVVAAAPANLYNTSVVNIRPVEKVVATFSTGFLLVCSVDPSYTDTRMLRRGADG